MVLLITVVGHNFTEAVKLYSEAIELNPTDATFWCNRATARTKLEEYGFALADACTSCFVIMGSTS